MTVYRADPPEIETLDIELTKKSGKNLGLGFFTSNPRGLLITDIVKKLFEDRKISYRNLIFLLFRFPVALLRQMDVSIKVIL